MNRILYFLLTFSLLFTACENDNNTYILQRSDIVIVAPEGGYITETGKVFELKVKSVSDEGITYLWRMGKQILCKTKDLSYVFKSAGQYILTLRVAQNDIAFNYNVSVEVKDKDTPQNHHSPYIAKVLDYRPAVGQFVNTLPEYVEGDTQEDMNRKAFEAIGKNNLGMITLGGFGGYVILGFDHTIENVIGKQDFRILGNAFHTDNSSEAGGSSEPGIIMVSYDANKNGQADDEWYELAGSGHADPTLEFWYDKSKAAGNDVNLYLDYEITYFRPVNEPKEEKDFSNYIRWKDNQGNTGFRAKNSYHKQPYYPLWITDDQLTFQGTCLPQNGIDESDNGTHFVSYPFRYGYADNANNDAVEATFNIDWAVTADGHQAKLKGIDFIKIYTGVNQEMGWIGECSTEISGVEDLHILGEDIATPQF